MFHLIHQAIFLALLFPRRPIAQAAVPLMTGRTSVKHSEISGNAVRSPRLAKAINAFLCKGFFHATNRLNAQIAA